MNKEEFFKKAAAAVEDEKRTKFKFLPGDPLKGTLYKGFVSGVEISIIENPESANVGREMLIIKTQVASGEFKGWEEVFNRVLHPVSLDEPTAEGWKKLVKDHIDKLKAGKNSPPIINEAEVRRAVETEWEAKVINHLKFTIQQFQYIGVDISSQDEGTILALAANATGNPVVWKVYDADRSRGHQNRRIFLEDARKHTVASTQSQAPNLYEELPDGNDIPLD